MGLMTALAIGGALGAAKYATEQESASRQRKLQGTLTTYSPWTGYKAPGVADPNAFGDILQGAGSAAMMSQALAAAAPAGAGATGVAGEGLGADGAAGMAAGLNGTATAPTLLDPSAYSALDANQATNPWSVMSQMNKFSQSPFGR